MRTAATQGTLASQDPNNDTGKPFVNIFTCGGLIHYAEQPSKQAFEVPVQTKEELF